MNEMSIFYPLFDIIDYVELSDRMEELGIDSLAIQVGFRNKKGLYEMPQVLIGKAAEPDNPAEVIDSLTFASGLDHLKVQVRNAAGNSG